MQVVLVPLDGSPFAEQAVPVATAIARRGGARVELVTVYETPLQSYGGVDARPYDGSFDQANRGALAQYIAAEAAKLEAEGVAARGAVLEGPPARAIAEHAREIGAGVIVVTTHGRRGPSRMWLGSVATELLQRAETPVLVVPATEGGGEPTAQTYTRILVGLDGSSASEAAVTCARGLLGTTNSEYVLARSVPGMTPFRHLSGLEDLYAREIREQQAAAGVYLSRVATGLRDTGMIVQTATPSGESEAEALVALAGEIKADVIALGAPTRSRLERLLLGSVADKVVRTSPVAVLVCRGAERSATTDRRGDRTPALTSIAVAVDFSEPSDAAAHWAAANFASARVTLIHAAHVPRPPSFASADLAASDAQLDAVLRDAERNTRNLADRIGRSGVETVVAAGKPSGHLVTMANDLGVDVIVVGEHGERSGMARMLGSTAECVLRTSSSPVLLARGLPDAAPRRILITIDDSDVTPRVLEWARLLCVHFRAPATLLHVVDPHLVGAVGIAGSPGEVQRARSGLRRASVRWLKAHADMLRSGGVDVDTVVVFGDPSRQILSRARKAHADLIVLGRTGAGRVHRAVIGSATDRVLRLGKGPVLVVPEPRG